MDVTTHPHYCTAVAWVWGALDKLSEEGLGAEEVVSTAAWGGLERKVFVSVSYSFTNLQGFIPLLGPRKINVWKKDSKFLTLAIRDGSVLSSKHPGRELSC